jgi:hypothetical protein
MIRSQVYVRYTEYMLKKYVDYFRNNPNHYWFKRKIWGWGWVPVTWQGWLTTFVYISLVLLLVLSREEPIPGNPDSGSNFLVLGLPIILLTALFIFIAYKKGEKPKWQWGLSDKEIS